MKNLFTADTAIADAKSAIRGDPGPAAPDPVVAWLARLRLLEGVPFAYLVPHDELLPPETIRFFYVNRNWTDAVVDGALSVGGVTSPDRTRLTEIHGDLVRAIDEGERNQRVGNEPATGGAEVITGFLLRSRAVSGWPGLEVHAERRAGNGFDPVRLLRVERLAPAVLLVLIDGIPDRISIEEPRQGIQFGADPADGGYEVPLKHPRTGKPLTTAQVGGPHAEGAVMAVPFREGSPGTVHVKELATRLQQARTTADDLPLVSGAGMSSEFAVQMLQFPYCQLFGGEEVEGWFVATLPIDAVRATFGEVEG